MTTGFGAAVSDQSGAPRGILLAPPGQYISGDATVFSGSVGDTFVTQSGLSPPLSGWSPASPLSGHYPVGLASSGSITPAVWFAPKPCDRCGVPITIEIDNHALVYAGLSGGGLKTGYYCLPCANYVPGKGIQNREDWIREGVPLAPGTPAGVVGDWLQDNSRHADAEYMYALAQRMSG